MSRDRPHICFLVLAHHQPAHVGRLVSALAADGDSVVVHVDAKIDQTPFEAAAPRASFVESGRRVRVRWAGFSTVRAMLELLAEGRRAAPDADHYWLVSGDAYPLRPVSALREHLAHHPGAQHLSLLPMPAPEIDKPLSRISHLYVEHDPRRHPWLHRLLLAVHLRVRRPYRRALAGMRPYCGSPWFVLTREAVDHVLVQTDLRPEFVRLSASSFCPDEHYVQTLIANSRFADNLRPSVQYHDFRPDGDRPLPAQMTARHLGELAALVARPEADAYGPREYLVARKFNDGEPEVVDAVEEQLWPLPLPTP